MSEKDIMFKKLKVKDQIPFLYDNFHKAMEEMRQIREDLIKENKELKERISNLELWIKERGVKVESAMNIVLLELQNAGKLPDKIIKTSRQKEVPFIEDPDEEIENVWVKTDD